MRAYRRFKPRRQKDDRRNDGLAKRCQSALREVYKPNGFNLGINFGKAAGVAEHFHLHILPRWIDDVNFMTAVGETRTIPEDLRTTVERREGEIATTQVKRNKTR